MRRFYLDYNASTPVHYTIINSILYTMNEAFANPSSQHTSGNKSAEIIKVSRQAVANFMQVDLSGIIFTSGATEAINLAIYSVLFHEKFHNTNNVYDNNGKHDKPRTLLYSSVEHKCVINALVHWNTVLQLNYTIVEIPVDNNGQVVIEILQQELPNAALLCVMAVNNETGIITDLEIIKDSIHIYNPDLPWLVDSVQAIGKVDIDFNKLGISYAAFSGHKIYAPKGCGVLYVKPGSLLYPIFTGEQENQYRAGTENVPAIYGFRLAVDLLQNNKTLYNDIAKYRDMIISELTHIFPNIHINNQQLAVSTVINFSVPGFFSKELIDIFAIFGIDVASGSACGSLNSESYVLKAMGFDKWIAEGAIRMSFSLFTTHDETVQLCQRIKSIALGLSKYKTINKHDVRYHYLTNNLNVIRFNYNGSNSWIIVNAGNCVIIDPVYESIIKLKNYILNNSLKGIAILDTHGHADHQSCAHMLRDLLAVNLNVDQLGWPIINTNSEHLSRIAINNKPYDALMLDTNTALIKILTPGHTDDSRTFIIGSINNCSLNSALFMFSGDNILINGLGRTNFVTSSATQLYESINHLSSFISDNCMICPAHDYNHSFATTFIAERTANLLMQHIHNKELAVFLHKKQEIDALLNDSDSHMEIIKCGVVATDNYAHNIISIKEVQDIIRHQQYLFIDVRDSIVHNNDDTINNNLIKTNPAYNILNVPYTHMVNFMSYCLHNISVDTDLLFTCNSGAASLYAAQAFARLGFKHSKSISIAQLVEAIC